LALATLSLALAGVLTLFQAPAFALNECNTNPQIFVRSSSDQDHTNGATDKILTGGALDSDCLGIVLGTAHTSRTGVDNPGWGDWVETGFYKKRNQDSSVDICRFTEWGTNFNTISMDLGCGAPLNNGYYAKWRVSNVQGTEDWTMYVDYLNGNGFIYEATAHVTWAHGVASGETERWGNNTDMSQSHRELQFKNNSNNWVDWPDANCIWDTSTSYSWSKNSATSYDIVNQNNPC
jgi:hypothetical protein